MKVVHLESLDKLDKDVVLALGFFDGIHLGHQRLINRVIEIAGSENLGAALLTFRRHPIEVLHPGLCFPYLTTQKEKISIVRKMGLEYFIDVDFTKEFSIISPESFVHDILLNKLRGKVFVVGQDYRFGFRAAGDVDYLGRMVAEQGGRVEVIENVTTRYGKVSSTFCREAIISSDIVAANLSLGRWYSIEGNVESGRQRGRTLGIPTANLELPTLKAVPRPGVYCVYALVEDRMYQAIGHIGDRPTFNEEQFTFEIHLFGFSGDLYGKSIRIFFLDSLRDTVRFPDAETMMTQIKADICVCRKCLSSIKESELQKNFSIWATEPVLQQG